MKPFRPLPLLSNPHVQTILGNILSGSHPLLRSRMHLIPLSDGDQLALHETAARTEAPRAPLALLVHGLGGSSRSPYIERMTHRLTEQGWRVYRVDLRAAGDGIRHARRFYNAACSADLRAAATHVAAAFPDAPLAIVGFSLGGNIVLKLAGELAEHPVPTLRVLAAIAPPIDLFRCSELISHHPLYDAFYVRHLTTQVRQHQRYFPELPRIVFPRGTTLRLFDELYTAPRWGYPNALDYYRQASTVSLIPAIRVPTYILTARDDPFVAVESFESLQTAPCVEIHITAHGGHLGFLGRDATGGIRWAETQVANWLTNQLKAVAE